ncbi:kinesin-7, putative [Plasmodium reichenowi]|uniref:Kinesin-7, putative n=1 Tax=Plasmodium reichenowi TaxID=5854 RepID=A0A2P9DHU4_PLARE|nr:kinesin-7, putative [Plasmodium reichenowi]
MELNKNEDINKINLDGIQVESSSKEEAIRVCTRIRPLFEKEINKGHLKAWKMNETDMHLIIDPPSMTEMLNARVAKKGNKIELKKNVEKSEGQKAVIQRHYAFDRCFDDYVGNDEVYKHLARDIILDTFKGINGCILAYGQTGSGKTHSVMGIPDDPGMLPRSLAEFFNGIENPSSLNENNINIGDDDGHSNESNNNNDNNNTKEFLMSVTYLEVYMERVNDLLQEGYRGGATENLDVKEDPKRGFVVIGIQEETVTSIDEVMLLVAKAEQRRHIAQTNFNETSSRSHTIFTVILESNQVLNDGTSINKKGELKIVDLAGNERAGRAAEGIENSKTLMEEGKAINKSLFVLSEVISKLSKRAQTVIAGDEKKIKRIQEDLVFIPWRDSKLTRILSKSLGGNCRASVIVAVHPSHFYLDTSFSTLRFALKCKTIKKKIEVNYLSAEQSVIMQQKELIAKLQNQLKHLATTKNVDMQLSGGGDNKYSTNRKPEDDEKILALKHELEEKVKKFQNFILKSEFHVNSSNYRALRSIDEHTEKSLKYSISISANMKNEYNWLRSLDTNEYDTKWDGFDKYDDQNAKEKFNISKAMDYLKNKSPYKLNSSEMSDILSNGSQKDDSISLNYYNELDELEKLEKNELMKREKKRKENNKEKDRDREKMDARSVVSNKVYDDITKLNIIENNNFNENKDKFHLKRKETKKKQKMQKRINNMMDYMTKGTLLFKKSTKLKNKNKKKKLTNNNININGDNINDDNINDDNINGDNINDDNINGDNINGDNINGDNINGDNINGDNINGDNINDDNINNIDCAFNTKKITKKYKKKSKINKTQQICRDKDMYETSSIMQNAVEEKRDKDILKEKGESPFQSFDNNINDTSNVLIKSISSSVKFLSSKERYNNNQKRKSIISNLKEKIEEDLKKKKKIINRNVELNKQIKFIMKLMQKLGLSAILTGTVPPGRNIENVLKLQENLKDDLRLAEYNKKSTNVLGLKKKGIYNENNDGNEIDEEYNTKNDNMENTLLNCTLDENENDTEYNETISHVFINEMFFSFVLRIQQKYFNKGDSLNDIEEILKNEEDPYDISKKALEEILGCTLANKVSNIEEKNCISKQIKDEKNKKTIDSILNMLTPWEQKILALLYEQQKMRQNVQKIKEKFSQRIQNINIFIKKILIDKIEVEKHLNRVLKATENYKEDLLKTSDVDSNFKFAGLMKKLEELSISLAEKNRDFNVLAEFHLNLRKTLEHKDNLIKELKEENKLFYLVPRYNELLQQLDETEESVTIGDQKEGHISQEDIESRVHLNDNNIGDVNKCDGNIDDVKKCDGNIDDVNKCGVNIDDVNKCDGNIDDVNKCDGNIDDVNQCDGNIYDGKHKNIATKELKKEFLLMYGRLMFSRKKLQEKEVIEHDMRNLNKKIYTELVESISVIKNLESQNKFLEFKLNMENKKKLEKIKKLVKEKEKLNKFIHEIEKRLQNENIDFEDVKKEILVNNNMSENNLESQDDENEHKDFIEKLENEGNSKNTKKGKKKKNKLKIKIKKKKEENEGRNKIKNYMKEKRVNKNGNNQNEYDHNDEETFDQRNVNKNDDSENQKIYYDENINFSKDQKYNRKEYTNNDYKFKNRLRNNILNAKIDSNLKKKKKIKIKKNISEEKIKLNSLYEDSHSGLFVGKSNKYQIDERKKKKIIKNKIATKNIRAVDGYHGQHIMPDKYLSSNSIINQKLMKNKKRIKNKKYIPPLAGEQKSFLDSLRSRNSVMKKNNKKKKKTKIIDKGKTKRNVEKNEPSQENQHQGNNNNNNNKEEEKGKEMWEEEKYNSSSTDFENNEVRQMLDVEIEKKKSNQMLH